MNEDKSNLLASYHAAKNEAVFYIEEKNGYIRFSGDDRIGFVDKLTTNDITVINPNVSITTILTSSIGRVLDVFQVIDEGDTLGAATLPGHGQPSADFLKGKIFFMDKVTVRDESSQIAQIDVEGPNSTKVLEQLCDDLPAELHQVMQNTFILDNKATLLAKKGLTSEIAYRILYPKNHLETLTNHLINAEIPQIDRDVREILRIEAGEPGSDSEYTQDYNPLEVNAAWTVSTTKGCYPGQEVIARQINYDKITKNLVQVKIETLVSPGNKIRVEGKNVGEITSSTESPDKGPIALAILKRPHHEPGSQILIESSQGEISGTVIF